MTAQWTDQRRRAHAEKMKLAHKARNAWKAKHMSTAIAVRDGAANRDWVYSACLRALREELAEAENQKRFLDERIAQLAAAANQVIQHIHDQDTEGEPRGAD